MGGGGGGWPPDADSDTRTNYLQGFFSGILINTVDPYTNAVHTLSLSTNANKILFHCFQCFYVREQ
jgi:hypothetical protein